MNPTESQEKRLREVQDQFILEWGRMSSSWGINRTMAQIHALLLVTGKPHSMDEIISRLGISRGNASMSLRDLMDWGVVQRFRRPGDRKDIYSSEGTAWQTVARIVRERKRREVDPTKAAIADCLYRLPKEDQSEETMRLRDRLSGMLEIFAMIDLVYDEVFKTDEGIEPIRELLEGRSLLSRQSSEGETRKSNPS
ncbi:MAG: transcriptional regulator [Armatimonadetes bacterium]|nr:transcriptional regulator [Armatimonadota bacterium]